LIKTASRNGRSNQGVLLDEVAPEHVCATCIHKQRVMISASGGNKIAAVWKCRELSKRFFKDIRIEGSGTCFDAGSITDYWAVTNQTDLVW
jgi:hypothetical protein